MPSVPVGRRGVPASDQRLLCRSVDPKGRGHIDRSDVPPVALGPAYDLRRIAVLNPPMAR
jgi:hypothetical protein